MAQQRGPMPGIFISHGRYYRVTRDGKRKVWTPLSRVDEGLAALHRAIADAISKPPPAADTVPELVARWTRDEAQRLAASTQKDLARLSAIIAKRFAQFRAEQVTPPVIVQYLREHLDKPRTYNAHRAHLYTLMKHAELIGWRAPGSNPVAAVRTAKNPPRQKYITDSELRRIKVAALRSSGAYDPSGTGGAGPTLCAVLELLYLTGQPIGDVLDLDAADVRGDTILFRRSKVAHSTGAAVQIIITPRLRAALDRLLVIREATRSASPALIVTRDGGRYTYAGIRSAWVRARDKAGVSGMTMHDIKAKALTDTEASSGMQAARQMGQHSTERQTADYVRNRSAAKVKATK